MSDVVRQVSTESAGIATNPSLRAIVIGSGFGGLACGIRLQAAGIPTTIVERRDQPGGRAFVIKDQGFTIDGGPSIITAPDSLAELFELAGQSIESAVELIPMSPFYRLVWENGFQFDYGPDLDHTLAQIEAKHPGDGAGYRRLLDYARKMYDDGYSQPAHVPVLTFRDMVRLAPQLVRLKGYRSMFGAVSQFIKDPELRQAFSFQSLLAGGNPFQASSIYTAVHHLERHWGVFFPKGGTNALVGALVRLFAGLGGTIRLNFDVDRIETHFDQVTGVAATDGELLPATIVVSNADVVHTYASLLREEKLARGTAIRLAKRRHSMSLLMVYFGTKRQYPELAHHTILFGQRYRALLTDIFVKGKLSDDFALYLHRPTGTDPSLAPSGCDAFYVMAPVPHLGLAAIDWKKAGPAYADRILDYLERRLIPSLRSEIATLRIFTPLDFQQELHAHFGSAFSLEPALSRRGSFRVPNRDPRIRGLYFVGAGTHPGAGLPGVISSAKATAGLVTSDQGHWSQSH